MRSKSNIVTCACVAALVFCGPSLAFAAAKKSASPSPSPAAKASASPKAKAEASPEAKAPRAIPFKGNATAVDQAAKTFTIAGKESSRVFKVTEKTTVTKMGSAAAMSDLAESDAVTGSYWKHEDGTLEAKSLKIGGKTESDKSSKGSKKDEAAEASPSASPKK